MNNWVDGIATKAALTAFALLAAITTVETSAAAKPPIVVRTTAELQAALVGENAGRLIKLLPGEYPVTAPLAVPDGVKLLGAGVMLGGGQPTGFAGDTVTRIHAAMPFAGDLLTLGDGVVLEGLVIEHATGAVGNAVTVASRAPGDLHSVAILGCEIINPNPSGIIPAGPTGEGVALVNGNPNLGADPPPYDGARIDLTLRWSIVRAQAGGATLFAVNFSSNSLVTLVLERNVIVGNLRLVGGVSRPDPVSGSTVVVRSEGNLYSGANLSVPLPGWQIYGGGTVPIPLPAGETRGNTVQFASRNDQLEGFQRAVLAVGGVRLNAAPESASDNRVNLKLEQLTISTPDDGLSSDLSLHGASSDVAMSPGDGNVLTVFARGVNGSGYRNNTYSNTTIQGVPSADQDNVLEIFGTTTAFDNANRDVLPPPDPEFFTGPGG